MSYLMIASQMAAGSRLQVQVMDFFFFHLLFKHALCSQVKLRALGLMAYWYTGFAFHQTPQSYLNDVHLVPSVVLRDNELLLWI